MPKEQGVTPEALQQLREQTSAANKLHEQNMNTVSDLQQQLYAGQISMKQYDDAIGQLFDNEMQNLAGDIQAQGRDASGIPTKLGELSGVAQQRYEAKMYARMNKPTPGDAVVAGPATTGPITTSKPLPPLSGTDALMFGPTDRPTESPNAGINRRSPGDTPMPANLVQDLPRLARLAMAPDAPPQLVMLVQMLAHYAEA